MQCPCSCTTLEYGIKGSRNALVLRLSGSRKWNQIHVDTTMYSVVIYFVTSKIWAIFCQNRLQVHTVPEHQWLSSTYWLFPVFTVAWLPEQWVQFRSAGQHKKYGGSLGSLLQCQRKHLPHPSTTASFSSHTTGGKCTLLLLLLACCGGLVVKFIASLSKVWEFGTGSILSRARQPTQLAVSSSLQSGKWEAAIWLR